MSRPASSEPTTGELEILQILWDAGPLALSPLCERIRASGRWPPRRSPPCSR